MSIEEKKLLIAIPIYNSLMALDAIGPFECLQQLPNVDVVFVGYEAGPYHTCLGKLCLIATKSFDEVPNPDIIIVPGGFDNRLHAKDQPIVDWIRKVHPTTIYTAAVCEGALLLGAAGLLCGVRANTHWAVREQLLEYGAILTDERVVREGKIFTTAGVSAGIDLGLTLVKVIIDEQTKEKNGDTIGEAVQVFLQYDPEPPFNGDPDKASDRILEIGKSWGANAAKYAVEHFSPPPPVPVGGGKAD